MGDAGEERSRDAPAVSNVEEGTVAASPRGDAQMSEAELGALALRAKQQRLKAEQDRQLLQARGPLAT